MAAIREQTGLSATGAAVLANRGIRDPGEAGRFLSGTVRDLSSPFRLKGLEEASRRIVRAGRLGEPVLVYADYDADGSTGAACLHLFLKEIFPSLPVRIHQNHRERDGYGMRIPHLEAAAREGIRLVVTVDLGISDREAVERAGELGMDVIVTDHHLPGASIPPALAVLNPKQADCPYPEKEIAGVGVVFLLLAGIRRELRGEGEGNGEPNLRRYLDLVALGTVADVVPLRGDNRILVRAGLEEIRNRPREGIRALLAASSVEPGEATEADLGFRLGPRLNAAGRVGESRRGFELLVADRREEAERLAAELSRDNARRQREEERVLRDALRRVQDPGRDGIPRAIVLADRDWHPGVLGIVASKIAERYFRPAALLRIEGEEARGSLRSADGFPLVEALEELSPLLLRYGGHLQAAGVALPGGNLEAFREGLCRCAARYAEGRSGVPETGIDAVLRLPDLTGPLFDELERFRPYGMGNEEPVLLARNVQLSRRTPFGAEGRHFRATVTGEDRWFEAVAFHRPEIPGSPGERYDLLFTPQRVSFRGRRSVRLLVRDLRPSGGPLPVRRSG